MIKTIIVDDDIASLNYINMLLREYEQLEVTGCFSNSNQAIEYLKDNSIEVAFVDLELGNMNGLDFANIIQTESPDCSIVFITAYNKYAVKAFQINALDYLLKPISKERLDETIKRILKKTILNNNINSVKKLDAKCFGRFTVSVNGEEILFRTKKAEEIVAILIDRRGQSISRNHLADLLWKEFDGDKANVNMNTTIHYTRKTLLENGIGNLIIYKNYSYYINLNYLNCDFIELMDFPLKEINESNIIAFEHIASLYTADYLATNDYSWSDVSRINSKQKYLSIIVQIAEYYKENKTNSKIIDLLKDGIERSPTNGKVVYYLIEALLESGYYSIAEEYYRFHSMALSKNFGRKPDKNLTELIHPQDPNFSTYSFLMSRHE